jgi:hypothetical protein
MKELGMTRVVQNERGMALALAIVALVIVGALVAGALFSATQEQRMAENTRFHAQSFGVVEAGAFEVIMAWPTNRGTYNVKRPYPTDSAAAAWTPAWQRAVSNTGSYTGSVYRLNTSQYLIDVTGRDTMSRANRLRGGGFSQRLGILTRVVPLQADVQAAMTIGAPVTWGGGNTFVNGADNPPPAGNNWSACGAAGPSLAGIRAKSIGDLGSSGGQFAGTPDSIISPTMDTSTFYNYGYTNYSTLISQANITLAAGNSYTPGPVAVGGVCQTVGQPTNWGDGNNHTNPCGGYFPIVYIQGAGTTNLTGGQGQGILLVDGNVSLNGNFTFYGLMVIRGNTTTVANATVKIYGALLTKNANFAPNGSGSGSFTVNWSSCSLSQALQSTGVGAMNRSRSWVPLY